MLRLLSILAITLLAISTGHAAEYAKGHEALEIFDAQGWKNSPTWVMVWVVFMALTFFAGLFFVRNHLIARWVVGGFIAGAILLQIAQAMGVVILSGTIAFIHIIAWSPALYQLLTKRPFLTAEKGAFKTWSGVITATIIFSFIFDIRDSIIYFQHVL